MTGRRMRSRPAPAMRSSLPRANRRHCAALRHPACWRRATRWRSCSAAGRAWPIRSGDPTSIGWAATIPWRQASPARAPGIASGLGDRLYGAAQDEANLLTSYGRDIAGTETDYASKLFGAAGAEAELGWNAETGIGTARNADYRDRPRTRAARTCSTAVTGGLQLGAQMLGVGAFKPPVPARR